MEPEGPEAEEVRQLQRPEMERTEDLPDGEGRATEEEDQEEGPMMA